MSEQGDCYVYVIACIRGGELTGPVKVGISNNPEHRLRTIRTSCPYEVKLAQVFLAPHRDIALELERVFHGTQAKKRLHGEWFDMTPEMAMFLMCINYRVGLSVNCTTLSEEETEIALELAGVLAVEEKLRAAKGETVQ